jgi:hypothetical protein
MNDSQTAFRVQRRLATDQLPSEYQLARLLCRDKRLRFHEKDFSSAIAKWSAPLLGRDMPPPFQVDSQINVNEAYCFYTINIPGRNDREIRNTVVTMAQQMFKAQGIALAVLRPHDHKPVFVVPAEILSTDDGKRRMAAVYSTAKAKQAEVGAAR